MMYSALIIFFISTSFVSGEQLPPTTGVAVEPDAQWCLGCICEAISGCNKTLTCEGEVCGLFRITWAYWADAGKFTLEPNEDPKSATAYSRCTTDAACAGKTVAAYLKRFTQDCNGDGKIDCFDYAAIHRLGGYGCKPPYVIDYFKTFSECEKHVLDLGATSSTTA